jgi:hypothetical protein
MTDTEFSNYIRSIRRRAYSIAYCLTEARQRATATGKAHYAYLARTLQRNIMADIDAVLSDLESDRVSDWHGAAAEALGADED